jgi:hypothetical protein
MVELRSTKITGQKTEDIYVDGMSVQELPLHPFEIVRKEREGLVPQNQVWNFIFLWRENSSTAVAIGRQRIKVTLRFRGTDRLR